MLTVLLVAHGDLAHGRGLQGAARRQDGQAVVEGQPVQQSCHAAQVWRMLCTSRLHLLPQHCAACTGSGTQLPSTAWPDSHRASVHLHWSSRAHAWWIHAFPAANAGQCLWQMRNESGLCLFLFYIHDLHARLLGVASLLRASISDIVRACQVIVQDLWHSGVEPTPAKHDPISTLGRHGGALCRPHIHVRWSQVHLLCTARRTSDEAGLRLCEGSVHALHAALPVRVAQRGSRCCLACSCPQLARGHAACTAEMTQMEHAMGEQKS